MAYECAGVLSLAYAFFLRADDAGQAPRNRLVAWLLAGVHKAITPKNFDRVAAFLVIGTFFAAYVGQRIETATLQNGWVCADNLGNLLFLFLLVGMKGGTAQFEALGIDTALGEGLADLPA